MAQVQNMQPYKYPLRLSPSAPTSEAPRHPAFRAQPVPQDIDGELIRARERGRRGDDVNHDSGASRGEGYPQELAQPTRVR